MLKLSTVLDALPAQTPGAALIEQFRPPARFRDKRFETYRPDPSFPSQTEALQRLRALASALDDGGWSRLQRRLRSALGRPRPGTGVYLDGGFGVGKTHLLAALWNAAPGPKAYLSFDELMYTIGLLGVAGAGAAFRNHRLICVDEWELDDPGNLQMALAFLRATLPHGTRIAVTSNTVPDELGRGRFPQKEFKAEIEELAGAFQVLRIAGEDYRHRHFEDDPGREHFTTPDALRRMACEAGGRGLLTSFPELLDGLSRVHPIRYAQIAEAVDALFLTELHTITRLPDALRWVHFVDKVYDAAVPVAMTSDVPLGGLFPERFRTGPYGKKFSRCLSRLEELLSEDAHGPG